MYFRPLLTGILRTNHMQTSFVEHLPELRRRLLWVVMFVVLTSLGCWFWSDEILGLMRRPVMPFLQLGSGGLVFTHPVDKFLAHIKVSLFAGILVASPLCLWQVWSFIRPGLHKNEKKYLVLFLFLGSVLFCLGTMFVYFVVYPMALDFLLHFGGVVDKPMLTLNNYLKFFISTSLAFGLAFEMPLVFVLLACCNMLEASFLTRHRAHAIVLMAVLSACITPPDVVSMFFMLLPLMALYEISILGVKLVQQRR